MKKIITITISLSVVALITLFTFSSTFSAEHKALIENVEALGAISNLCCDEYPECDCDRPPVPCYNTITTQKGSQVRFCGSCTFIPESTYTTFSGTSTCIPPK